MNEADRYALLNRGLAAHAAGDSFEAHEHFEDAWRETPVYWRDRLPLAFEIEGPAIVEQMDTTILIEPGDVARGDAMGNIVIGAGAAA